MSKPDDLIYELRLYSIAPGRIDDMVSRFREDLSHLFPKHGVRPLAGWTALAGRGMPKFVYIMPWKSLEQRAQALAGFATDPDWIEARNRTNGRSELVERYDIFLLKGITPVQVVQVPPVGAEAVYELVIQEAANGRVPAARTMLLDVEMPAVRKAGAAVIGCFDLMIGPGLPAVVSLLEWPSIAARDAGYQQAECDERVQLERKSQIRDTGRCALGAADRYVLKAVDVQWARGGTEASA